MAKRNNKRSTSQRTQAQKPRNPYADHPLMRKGGVHQKSTSALRAKARRELKQLTRDGFDQVKKFFSLR
jgi:hypothetical protein